VCRDDKRSWLRLAQRTERINEWRRSGLVSDKGPLVIRSCDSVVKPMNMVGRAVTLVRQSVKATPHVTAMIGSMHAHDCSAGHGDEH
jgi:hypothetical protein